MTTQSRVGILVVLSICVVVGAAIGVLALRKPPAETQPVERTPYTVDGVIHALPDVHGEMWIVHEAIPEFKDGTGKIVGMGAMNMGFHLADGVSLEGLEVGDPVTFTFDVWWEPETGWELTSIQRRDD